MGLRGGEGGMAGGKGIFQDPKAAVLRPEIDFFYFVYLVIL